MPSTSKNGYIHIRKAVDSDLLQLERLFLTARRQTFHWVQPDRFKLEDYQQATKGELVFVAEKNSGQVVGFMAVYAEELPLFIHHLFIAAEYQRQGIGAQLIHSLTSWCPPPYRLKCLAKNENAIAFYLKHDWIEIDRGYSEEGEYLLLELNSL